jgi:vitamin B12 transporter
MRNYLFIKNRIVFFNQWQNQNFAIFSSLKKLVKIAALPAVYTLLLGLPTQAQTDSIKLEEIVIESSRIPLKYMESTTVINIIDKSEIVNLPVLDIHDLLNYAVGIDIRQRGNNGVQSDLSIRGGSFEQTLVLLNGVKLNDPQTGHHNLNLPIDLESIERIEILQGPGARIYGPSAFSGAINIITNNSDQKYIKANLGAGQYGYKNGSFSSSYKFNEINNYFSYSFKESDGYIDNTDFENSSLFYQVENTSNWIKFSGQAGYSNKAFGANSFYSPMFPQQFEKAKTVFASTKFEKNFKHLSLIPSFYWRRHQDHFRLERNNPDFYTNNHLTNVLGSDLSFILQSKIGITALGIEYRNESILSNVLGEPTNDSIKVPGESGFYFTHEKSRNDVSLFFQHNLIYKKINIDIGLISYYKTDYNWETFPGINLSYKISDKLRTFIGYNYSFRIPSFTELYYVGSDRLGNANLKPEKSATINFGTKYFNQYYFSQLSLFYRNGYELIDWALDTSDIWISRNVNDVNAYGFEYELKFYFNRANFEIPLLQSFRANYSYLEMDKSSGEYQSLYVLDYLKHKLVLQTDFQLIENIGFSFAYNFQNRSGTFVDFSTGNETAYDPFNTFDINIYWQENRFKVYFYVNNLFDVEYSDLANITMPGRWLKFGIKYNLPL